MTDAAAVPQRAAVLYTPELLALAVSLGTIPFDETMPFTGEARSRTCGSSLRMSLATDDPGRISRVGLRAAACAVGQAAAAIFAQGAEGLGRRDISDAREAIAHWLVRGGTLPSWPGLDVLEAARAHTSRHGAILLPWDAALAALPNAEARG